MNRLQYIFENNITLKSDKWIHYFEIYEKHFGHLVGKDITLVEVGVSGGGSLQMWRKYFGPNAKIVGIDNDPNCLSHLAHYDSNTSVIIGDQGDTSFWDQVLPSIGPIDIFIDDGGHLYYQQITTFDKVFPVIKENGVFLCEDTHTNFHQNIYEKNFLRHSYNHITAMHKHWSRYENLPGYELEPAVRELHSVSFYDSVVVFEKRKSTKCIDRKIVNENGVKSQLVVLDKETGMYSGW